jgi:hypothetical protein
MTKSRVPLIVSALIGAFMFAEYLVGNLVQFVVLVWFPGGIESRQIPQLIGGYPTAIAAHLVELVFFAAGAFVAFRYVAPVRAEDSWKRTVGRGVIAALFASAGAVVLGLIEAFLSASSVSSEPFGYAFGYSFAPDSLAPRLPQVFEAGVYLMIDWSVVVVFAAVLLKIWLGRQVPAVIAPASAAAKS